MTRNTMPSKGRYGVIVPYALIMADFVVLNMLLVAVWLINSSIPYETLRLIVVAANTAYLPVASMSLPMRRARAIHMEKLIEKALQMVVIHAIIFFAIVAFLGISDISWSVYVEFYIAFFLGLPLSWIVTRLTVKGIRRRGRNYLKVIIIGNNESADRLANELQRDPGFGYNILGIFDNTPSPEESSVRFLGTIDNDLKPFLEQNHIDEIYYTLPGNDEKALSTVIRLADKNIVTFYYVPHITRTVARSFYLTHIGSMPVLAAHNNPLDNPVNRIIKRLFDITFSSVILLLSPVIFIPVAIAVKCSSPGPIFFRQRRTGYRGNEFTCLKFRTMRINDDADKFQATANDPRKTRVGDFLRRTSIDELPQFINVFLGDMSVVGPRPHMVKHTSDYSRLIDRYMLRHVIKPGITGWAQVLGYRGATKELWQMEGRVEKDVWYIENWSLMLDLKIIVRTITNALSGEENAY